MTKDFDYLLAKDEETLVSIGGAYENSFQIGEFCLDLATTDNPKIPLKRIAVTCDPCQGSDRSSIYIQTWAKDHQLRIATTCLQRPVFLDPDLNVHNIALPLTTFQQRPLIWGPMGGCCTQIWLYYMHAHGFSSVSLVVKN